MAGINIIVFNLFVIYIKWTFTESSYCTDSFLFNLSIMNKRSYIFGACFLLFSVLKEYSRGVCLSWVCFKTELEDLVLIIGTQFHNTICPVSSRILNSCEKGGSTNGRKR